MGLLDFFKKDKSKAGGNGNAAEVTAQLESLGYFKYADAIHLDQLKTELGEGLANEQYLPFVMAKPPSYEKIDPRHFILDGEDLFEEGGVTAALSEMAPLFERIGVRMELSDHVEICDEDNLLTHELTMNGKRYVIFNKFGGYGWGEVAQRLADIINEQLMLQQSVERIYLIHGANDGRAIFLTAEQYTLLQSLIEDDNEKPWNTADWCQKMGVTYKRL